MGTANWYYLLTGVSLPVAGDTSSVWRILDAFYARYFLENHHTTADVVCLCRRHERSRHYEQTNTSENQRRNCTPEA